MALRLLAAHERVCDSALLDRVVRGRLWIGLLAFLLIGLVAMQLMVLKLNNGVGAMLVRAAALQRANAQLGIEAATGSGEGRIEPLAAATGMTFAPPGSVHFVASSPAADIAHAAAVLAAPLRQREYLAAGSQAPGAWNQAEASGGGAGSGSGSGEAGSGEAGSGEAGSGSGEAGSGGAGSGAAGRGEAQSSPSGSGESSLRSSVEAGGSPSTGEARAAGSGAAGTSSQESRGTAAAGAATASESSSSGAGGGVPAGR